MENVGKFITKQAIVEQLSLLGRLLRGDRLVACGARPQPLCEVKARQIALSPGAAANFEVL